MMIEERKATSPGPRSPKKEVQESESLSSRTKEKRRTERENVWEARRNEALLDAGNIERGILKDILFSETTKNLSRSEEIVFAHKA